MARSCAATAAAQASGSADHDLPLQYVVVAAAMSCASASYREASALMSDESEPHPARRAAAHVHNQSFRCISAPFVRSARHLPSRDWDRMTLDVVTATTGRFSAVQ
jgi:hypothetical protein